jgi:hypothetical protein
VLPHAQNSVLFLLKPQFGCFKLPLLLLFQGAEMLQKEITIDAVIAWSS